jgi:cation diffusion facilitator family transporter
MASSRSVVLAALFANGAIAILKFIGFLLTGSAAMLSETYHSISDTGNQVFLLIGIRYSKRASDRHHPFGYGKAEFFYSFLVSVLLFGIAGWESAKHGWNEVTGGGHGGEHAGGIDLFGLTYTPPEWIDPLWVNYGVLIGAIIFEAYALKKANAGLKKGMRENGWSSYREAFRKTSDVTTLTAFTEDSIAMAGAGIALLGVFLSSPQGLGDPIYDSASALLIGLMLMGFALALAWENKRLLLGESLPEAEQARLRRIVEEWDGVDEVVDFRTVYFGPDSLLVTADVAFEAGIATAEMDERITAIEDALIGANETIEKVYVEPERTGAG